jgi:hypothetical protein
VVLDLDGAFYTHRHVLRPLKKTPLMATRFRNGNGYLRSISKQPSWGFPKKSGAKILTWLKKDGYPIHLNSGWETFYE